MGASLDEAIMYALADWRIHWLNRIVTDITSLGSMTVISIITATAFALLWIIAGDRAGAARIALAAGGAEAVVEILKRIIARPRPDIIPHLVDFTGFTFPSGHALVATAAYSTLSAIACGYVEKRKGQLTIRIVCWTLIALIAFSRVYLGVHYPSDVATGILLGWGWAFCAERICRRTPSSLRQ